LTVWIGTSGWQYRHWLGRFYPDRPRIDDDLAYYAARFATVELNGTFYRLPAPDTFDAWRRRVPDDFVFAVKASRFLTHIKRMRDPGEPVARLMSRTARLGEKMGPILLQLPPTMRCDEGLLNETLEAFPRDPRIAIEFRHDSWFTRSTRRLLERRGVALCIADRASRLASPAWDTSEWGYMRLHAGQGSPESCYGRQALEARAQLVRAVYGPDAHVFVYFNNDGHGCALRDARRFALYAARQGLEVSRVPDAEVSVA
jgi:uncharacterized protein YecE (DUF72 family)